ncbi:MAG TPA: oxaloacetate decarboxylase [Actinomycetes bacterium]|nr:oxaloacetate decarboxylase [Actinomycetes bacterium]
MSERPNARLRRRIGGEGGPLLLPGAPNALTARLIEETGFEAVYISGAGIANTYLGAPDIGLVTLSELADHVGAVRDAVSLPIVVDGDTGFGNAINVARTVRLLERAGANAIQLEDQVSPKRCGHFEGKAVISTAEMVGKIKAATDARQDDHFVLIARTDALALHGLADACDRAEAYLAAGADVAFVEAPVSRDELCSIPTRVSGPTMANIVEGGKTPPLTLADLAGAGFRIVLYANTAMRAAMLAMRSVLAHLHQAGDSLALHDQIASWEERQALVRKPEFDALDRRYAGGPA